MDDEEPRIQIKLRLDDTPQTKSNGKKSINTILANFQCGLPSPIQENDVEFSLFKSRKDKNQLLLVEDRQNQVLYYDKRVPNHLLSQSHQIKKIGVFDTDSNEVTLFPVTYSFNMKSETINNKNGLQNMSYDIEDDKQAKHQDLVETFGSKFAVKNMNKQTRLQKTKNATIAAMDRMDTAQLINDKEEEKEKEKKNKKRKRSEMETQMEIFDENEEYVNIFQHTFSPSPYCLFEFKHDKKAKKTHKVYKLREIIPAHIWKSNEMHHAKIWKKFNQYEDSKNGLKPSKFVSRCRTFCGQVFSKKGEKKFKSWQNKLVLYEISVRFLRDINNKSKMIDHSLWQNMKAGYLEQFVYGKKNQNKRVKYSMTRRSKMRIVGVVLLIALNIAFWKISVEACQDIAEDLQIPVRVVVEIYRLLGCEKEKENDKTIAMKTRVVRRKPTTTLEGDWWRV